MKKTLIMACALIVASASVVFADEVKPQTPVKCNCQKPCNCQRPPQKGPDFKKRQAEFEQRLKLTDEQKAKAKELREQGFEKMKPIMEKMKEKRAEIETVKRSRISVEAQNERIEQLKKEIGALKNEAHRLRMENMKAFEGILTKSQLKELKKMKEEGRKNFDKEFKKHPHRGEFGPHSRAICPPAKDGAMAQPDYRPVE